MKRLALVFLYFPCTILFLLFLLVRMPAIKNVAGAETYSDSKVENSFKFYAALPAIFGSENSQIITGDARPYILQRFILKYYKESPLLPFTQYLVDTSDQYNLDFRLLTAIAMQESNLCKRIPEGSRNCWGHGIYGDKVLRYDSYEEAILDVSKTLSKYALKGRLQPEEIMQLYTPSSNGSWAFAVRKFMDIMK